MEVITIFIASSILFLIMVVLVIAFVVIYQKKLLQQQYNLQQLKHNQEMDLMQATIDAQEQEQNRIGKDLHDDLGALLTASRIQIQQIERSIDKDSTVNQFVALSSEMLDQSIIRLSAIAKSLSPPTLKHFGIKDATEEYVTQFAVLENVKINTSITQQRFSPSVELALFRMTQELVNNTIKYADATEISISIFNQSQQVHLNYSDNGKGFDHTSVKKGLGLRNLEGRTTKLKGKFTIESDHGKGFRATIIIPLEKDLLFSKNGSIN